MSDFESTRNETLLRRLLDEVPAVAKSHLGEAVRRAVAGEGLPTDHAGSATETALAAFVALVDDAERCDTWLRPAFIGVREQARKALDAYSKEGEAK